MLSMSRGSWRRAPSRAMAGGACAIALTLSGVAGAGPAQAEGELPILGQVRATSSEATADDTMDVLISVHGVRRVEDHTIVYYSVGFTPDTAVGSERMDLIEAFGNDSIISPLAHVDSEVMGDVTALDMSGRKAYTTMYTGKVSSGDTDCLCQGWLDALPSEPKPGTAYAATAALPELPEGVDRVTMRVLGHFMADIPVEDGAMEPAVEDEGAPVVVGTGWPKISEALTDVSDPSAFVLPLSTHEKVEGSAVSERIDGKSRSIDLSADVLFDVDKATLTGKAKKEIQAAAKKIKESGATGSISVTGHTDSSGGDSHNQDLSERRAESVAKALKPLLPSGVKLTTDGKGESDPIASNKTTDGKALNRRVTITLPGAKG